VRSAYRLLCSLSSHDISAMRELVGVPNSLPAAAQWNKGRFISAMFEYDDYYAVLETGVDSQRRFDAHIEVYGETKSLKRLV
jgi:predicted dehydrogenase